MQWNHTIPENKVNGILIGYTVHWDDERFGHGHRYSSKGVKDLELNATNYTITSLHEYWPYTISVAGRTSKGAGIRTLRRVTTIDDGKNHTSSLQSKYRGNIYSVTSSASFEIASRIDRNEVF